MLTRLSAAEVAALEGVNRSCVYQHYYKALRVADKVAKLYPHQRRHMEQMMKEKDDGR